MTPWVIFGCGYVGSRLARALLDDGVAVRLTARNTSRLEPLALAGAEVKALDAARPHAFGPALFGLAAPVVVYSIPLVAALPPGEAVRRAARAAAAVGAPSFIYLGSTAVYGGQPGEEWVDEETSLANSDPDAYPRIAEEGAVEVARLGGLRTTVLRLAAIYGPGRGVRERIKAGTYKLIDGGRHYFSRVHVDDIVAVVRAAAERAPAGAVYCVGDNRPTTQAEYAQWLAARLEVALPPAVPREQAGAMSRFVRNRRISNARLKRELGLELRYPTFVEGERAIEAEAAAAV